MNKYKCPLTALQFLTMRFINKGIPGPRLRETLEERGQTSTKAAFYQLMARLESRGFVSCTAKTTKGQHGVSSFYAVTANGKEAMSATQKFYARRTP